MFRNIPFRIIIGFAASALITLVIGALAYYNVNNFLSSNQWESHTYQVLTRLEYVLSDLKDIETGSRGYIVTGKENFLEPYHSGVQVLGSDLAYLKSLIADNREQLERLKQLEILTRQKFMIQEEQIKTGKTEGLDAARVLIADETGKRKMDEIRRKVAEMRDMETDLLARRIREREIDTFNVFAAIAVMIAFLLAAVILVMIFIKKELDARQKLNSLLAESLEYSNMIIDTVPTPLLVLDADLTIVKVSRSFHQHFSRLTEGFEKKSFFEILDGNFDHRELRQLLHSVIPENKTIENHELTLMEDRIISLSARKLYRKFNNVHLILLAMEDVTEKKRMQKESEDLLNEQIINQVEKGVTDTQKLAHAGSLKIDLKTGRVQWSQEMFRIYERDPNEKEPSFEEMIEVTHPADKDVLMLKMEERPIDGEYFEAEYRIVTKTGVKYLYMLGRPNAGTSGKTEKVTGTVMDITERELSKRRLVKTLLDLERSNKELQEFLFVANHDLKEPLRMANIYSTIIKDRYYDKLDDKANEYISIITGSVKRINLLINDLLAYARVTSGGSNFKKIELDAVLDNALRQIKTEIEESEARIMRERLPEIIADSDQIEQVFINLISNAIKFRGERPPEIYIKATSNKDECIVNVRDNGIGIGAEYFDKIFQLFQVLNDRKDYQGTGIGLALCKRIIERHDGKIWVESEPGKGSVFYFSLPFKE